VTDPNNRLASDGTYSYQYDDEGNRTRKTTTATGEYVDYQWDHRNRLARVEFRTSGGTLTKAVEYDYDTADRRIAKRVDDNGDGSFERAERFVYDGSDVVLVFDDAGSLTNRYLHGPEVDQLFADEDAVDGLLWALTDHQQTVRDLVDSTGTVVNHIEYDSFGEITGQSNSALTPLSAYTGQHWDADAGLYYYDARWYDAGVGRFLSEDPSGLGPDANLYRPVCREQPVELHRPDGTHVSFPTGKRIRGHCELLRAGGDELRPLSGDYRERLPVGEPRPASIVQRAGPRHEHADRTGLDRAARSGSTTLRWSVSKRRFSPPAVGGRLGCGHPGFADHRDAATQCGHVWTLAGGSRPTPV
jgi:RHS repeat-associated protein